MSRQASNLPSEFWNGGAITAPTSVTILVRLIQPSHKPARNVFRYSLSRAPNPNIAWFSQDNVFAGL
jgi:hypothetical protein